MTAFSKIELAEIAVAAGAVLALAINRSRWIIRARRFEREITARLQSTELALLQTNELGKITRISPGFTTLTGFERRDAIGLSPAMVLNGQKTDPKAVDAIRAACRLGQTFEVNILNYFQGNRPQWVCCQGTPVTDIDGRTRGYLITLADLITTRKSDDSPIETEPNAASDFGPRANAA